MDEVFGLAARWTRPRDDGHDRGVTICVGDRLTDECDIGVRFGDRADRHQCGRRVVDSTEVGDDSQGAVESRPETLGEDVVRLALCGLGRLGSVVGKAETDGQQRCGQHEHDGDATKEVHPGPVGDPLGEPSRDGLLDRDTFTGGDLDAGDGQAVDVVAGESEQRWDESDGDEHGDGDGCGCAQAHHGEKGDAGDEQSGKGDDHGAASEDDRSTGRGVGACRGFLWGESGSVESAVTSHDEQRVVDADGESDHDRQRRCGAGQISERRDERDAEDRDQNADEGGEQWQTGRDDGTKRDQQHDDGDGEPDQLGGRLRLLDRFAHRVTTERDRQCRGRRFTGGLDDRADLFLVEVDRRLAEADFDEGDSSVGRGRHGRHRIGGRYDVG